MAKIKNIASEVNDPFKVPVAPHGELQNGMEYTLLYNHTRMNAPNVPPPVARSSLAQQFLTHRYQFSRYLSKLRYYGLRPDYPVFHGFVITPQGDVQTTPVAQPAGIAVRQAINVRNIGSMGAPPRWKKALPTPVPVYNPPTY